MADTMEITKKNIISLQTQPGFQSLEQFGRPKEISKQRGIIDIGENKKTSILQTPGYNGILRVGNLGRCFGIIHYYTAPADPILVDQSKMTGWHILPMNAPEVREEARQKYFNHYKKHLKAGYKLRYAFIAGGRLNTEENLLLFKNSLDIYLLELYTIACPDTTIFHLMPDADTVYTKIIATKQEVILVHENRYEELSSVCQKIS
jgi:hypothetical protein